MTTPDTSQPLAGEEVELASILLVDDRPENLLALEAILEPLGRPLVSATSGEAALKHLLHHEVAVILLDVQMPNMDGFETAQLIKEREKTRHIPLIFLTAISKDATNVLQGYEAGAVDYVMKPFDAHALRSKVSVFVELWEKRRQVEEQAERIKQQELTELERQSEQRYRFLAESIPQQVWTTGPDGAIDYVNRRVLDYFGIDEDQIVGSEWAEVARTGAIHPDDVPETIVRWTRSMQTGEPCELEFRLRRGSDGLFRWHLARAVAFRNEDGDIVKWFGTNTDLDDLKRIEQAREFIVEASAALGSSLDYESTLADVARLAVPRVADWCVVSLLEEDGTLREIALEHADEAKLEFVRELRVRYPDGPEADAGLERAARTGEAQLVPELTDAMLERAARDDLHLALLRELGLRSFMCVPLRSRDHVLGAMAFVLAESGRRYQQDDLLIAEELARRAATAIDNAQLYHQAERRAQAAQVLETVGDGVFLLDQRGIVRLWNAAASQITGLAESRVVGRHADDVIPGWRQVAPHVRVAEAPGPGGTRPETVPIELDGRELWLSITGVGFDEGTVYAFRDITEERAVEEMKADFVATVSHELRTPLAAIYGAAVTLRRADLHIGEQVRDKLLDVVTEESERLAQIVNDVLLASHLDSGRLELTTRPTDVRELAQAVLESAETHRPDNVQLRLRGPKKLPHVAADPDQLRRVLVNLVDNAIKYSPDGGPVEVALARANGSVRIAVNDRGLGIPPQERERIFEKFYRLDPNMTRGIGGTGLGLYISRELVRRLDGRIWVEDSGNGAGSSFVVEIPIAREAPPASPRADASTT